MRDSKLIAYSGFTRCNWVISDMSDVVFQTRGINPFYQEEEDIEIIVSEVCEKMSIENVDSIHFYGAGCFFPQKQEIVRKVLAHHIPGVNIEVESDLLAAARASCGREPGIACILGTGSNSCFYNGFLVEKNVSPLGYILGDEGSRVIIGKIFINNLLNNQYSNRLYEDFMKYYYTSPQEIVESVYKKTFPDRYLAQFTEFIAKNINEPAMYDLIFNAFSNFITKNVMKYNYMDYPVHFTGSLAACFEDILRDACLTNGIRPGEITRNPLKGLIEYHH
ncbi:MAG: ATPase [Dysgonamonadaceae bacterium]|nr:ATPase [Dysgonamonadaceae bacterium]